MPVYRPWKHSQRRLALSVLTAAVSSSVFYVTHTPLSAAIAMGFSVLSVLIYRSIRRRRFGQRFETVVAREAERILASRGYSVERNRLFFGGDIDLIVTSASDRHRIPVEIKSFRRFYSGSRETRAMDQVRRQMQYLSSPAGIVWLPQGYGTAADRQAAAALSCRYPGVSVAFGGADALHFALRQILR